MCMAPAQNGTVLLSFNTDTPFLCCINCSTCLQCGAWSWKEKEASAFSQNKGNGTCTLLTAPGQVTKSAACQCGSSPAPSPGSSWQLIPLNSQWKNPVKESGIGRSSHGLNAIAVRFSNSALNTADSIVSSSGIMVSGFTALMHANSNLYPATRPPAPRNHHWRTGPLCNAVPSPPIC